MEEGSLGVLLWFLLSFLCPVSFYVSLVVCFCVSSRLSLSVTVCVLHLLTLVCLLCPVSFVVCCFMLLSFVRFLSFVPLIVYVVWRSRR